MDRKCKQKGERRGTYMERKEIKQRESGIAAAVTSPMAWKDFPHYYPSFSQQEVSADKENYLLDTE